MLFAAVYHVRDRTRPGRLWSAPPALVEKGWHATATLVYLSGERLVARAHPPVKRRLFRTAALVVRRAGSGDALRSGAHRGNFGRLF